MASPTLSDLPGRPPIPPDDPQRRLTVVRPNSDGLQRVALAGDVYTILLSGEQTEGRYCLIDMQAPPGGGPPPHRHDFEEMFTVLHGRIRFTFRGEDVSVNAGETVNIPTNAPHFFPQRRAGTRTDAVHVHARGPGGVLPAGRLPGRRSGIRAAGAEQAALQTRAEHLAARYRTELL